MATTHIPINRRIGLAGARRRLPYMRTRPLPTTYHESLSHTVESFKDMRQLVDWFFDVSALQPSEGRVQEDHESDADNLEKKRLLYQWELSDLYPPHCKIVPDKIFATSILDPTRLYDTLSLIYPEFPAAIFDTLAPSSKITTMQGLETFNSDKHSGHHWTGADMYSAANVGLRSDWYTDAIFAHQQFIGVNPTSITRASTEWIQNFTKAAYDQNNIPAAELFSTAPALLPNSFDYQTLLNLGPLDAITSDIALDDAPDVPRYGCASVALFQLLPTGVLHPLAIVLNYKGSIDPTVSTTIINKRLSPDDSSVGEDSDWPWRYAKMCAQVSDWTHHELTVHLVRTHLIEEATIVAGQRNFPDSHIMFLLLSPHWQTTLSLNSLRKTLVEQMMGPISPFKLPQLFTICNDSYYKFDWVGSYVPADLVKRGFPVDQLDVDPKFHNYAYARSVAAMWTVLQSFVGKVLTAYYKNGDSDVAADPYVSSFCLEMQSNDGAGLPQFPTVTKLADLIDMVTMCIHIAAPQHTAVNYLQQSYQTFIPNKPSALYTPLPQSLQDLQQINESDVLAALPLQVWRDWLMMAQVPYLLSAEVTGDQNIIEYAKTAAASKNPLIASAGKDLEIDIGNLTNTFKENSDAMDDQITKYMVLDPKDLAAAIVI
ncbi:lipoxygenase [Crassisporium funariophilum]|nr:lipoxygenase [Crassisporium funariophilum]